MNKKIFIRPYKSGSHSVNALCEALGARKIRVTGSRYKPRPNHAYIVWGGVLPAGAPIPPVVLNRRAGPVFANKANFFENLKESGLFDENLPFFYTRRTDLIEALDGVKKVRVYCRELLNGHGGAGITVLDNPKPEDIPVSPLYTLACNSMSDRTVATEFRINFVSQDLEINEDTDVSVLAVKKAARAGNWEEIDHRVKNHDNGWVFAELSDLETGNYLQELTNIATKFCRYSGLHFGALDIIYNRKKDKYFLLEYNSAPGIEGRTVEFYADSLKEVINEDYT